MIPAEAVEATAVSGEREVMEDAFNEWDRKHNWVVTLLARMRRKANPYRSQA